MRRATSAVRVEAPNPRLTSCMKLAILASMAMESTPAPRNRFRVLVDALFGEAWRLQRRRRRRWALLALVASAAVAGVVFGPRGGGSSSRSAAVRAGRPVVASVAVPALGDFPELSVARGRLIVSGRANTKIAGGRVVGTCAAVSVDPHTLRVLSVVRGNCGNPALYGERVVPVVYQVNPPNPRRGWGTDELGIRIATVDRSASAGYRLGPLVVGYPDCSTCRAQMIDGDGALWIYAPVTSPGAPGELLRISLATGLVTHRWILRTPMIRVLLATDRDGLWLAPGAESCCSGPRSSWVGERFLYHVAADIRAPAPVLDIGSNGAGWLVASGHTVWVQGRSITGSGPRWRLDRTHVRAMFTGARVPERCFDLGEGSPIVLGSGAIGIYCVTSSTDGQRVVRVSPDSRGARTVTTISTTQEYATPDSAVTLDGSYYFLDPPNTIAPAGASALSTRPAARSPAVIYRIRAR